MSKKRVQIIFLRYVVSGVFLLLVWGCSFLGERDRNEAIVVEFNLKSDRGVFKGMGANVPISFYNRRMKPLQTFNDLDVKYVRVKREGDNWDNILALRSTTGRLGIKWIYSIDEIPPDYLNQAGELVDVPGFAIWWADEVDELYYQEVPADYIELLARPDIPRGDSLPMDSDTYNALIHATREQLDLREFQQVGIVGPGLSSPSTGGDLETWYMDLDQAAFDALDYWTVQLWEDYPEASLNKFSAYLETIDSRKPTWISAYASLATAYGDKRYPDPNQYDVEGNLKAFKTYYYSASFSLPYGLRLYSNTLDLLKQRDVTPFIYQLYDAPSDVKYKKQSWGLLDLNGVAKPSFVLLSNLMKRIPKEPRVIPATYHSGPGLNALAFTSHKQMIITLVNEELEPQSIEVQVTGGINQLDFITCVSYSSSVIHAVELGQRDYIESKDVSLKIKKSTSDNAYAFSVYLEPQSVLVAEFKL